MCSWLKTHSEAIQAGAAIVGVCVATVGFGVTIWQLINANTALRASNAYTIQRDARDLLNEIAPNIRRLERGSIPEDEMDRVLFSAWKMLNFYVSVYRQVQAGGLSSEFSGSYRTDFCDWIKKPSSISAWEKMKSEKMLGQTHVAMRESWCAKN